MVSVTLDQPSVGFVGVELVAFLRTHGFGLAESHRLTTEVNDGRPVSIFFDQAAAASDFADAVRSLHIQASLNAAAAARLTA